MPDEGSLVDVWRAAAAAVLGVEGVLELRQGLCGIVDPEVGDAGTAGQVAVAAEVGDQRVVGVEREPGPAGEVRHELRPLVGEMLQLPVAIELVAEQVAEHDQARLELGRHPGQPGLVHLEQALLARLLEQRGRHAPAHVRAGAVVNRYAARRPQRRGEHPGGGRLAVGGADDHGAAGQPRAEPRDRIRRQAQQQAAGQRCAAAAPAATAERPRCPRQRELGAEHAAHGGGAITVSARGRRRIVAGRSAR